MKTFVILDNRVWYEIVAYARTMTSDAFKIEDMSDDILESLEREDNDTLATILGYGEGSQSIKSYAEERGLQERYL